MYNCDILEGMPLMMCMVDIRTSCEQSVDKRLLYQYYHITFAQFWQVFPWIVHKLFT